MSNSKLNILVNTIAYADITASNNPQIRNFDLSYKNQGIGVQEPRSETIVIPPQTIQSIFNGTRATSIDGTTEFTSTRPDLSKNIYRFTATAGTAPALRTGRATGIDNTTELVLSVNGPIATLTYSSGTLFNTTAIQVGDILKVMSNSGTTVSNQGRFTILSKTSTSISFSNLSAVAQTFTVVDFNDLLVYSNGSSNQIQIGDALIISSGFSSSIFGTYEIVEVTPSWFEISIAAPNGIPLEDDIAVGLTGLVFYSSAKSFLMVAAQQRCSIRLNADTSDNNLVEPVVANDPEKPGLFLKQGTVYSVSINNLSLEPLTVLVASAE